MYAPFALNASSYSSKMPLATYNGHLRLILHVARVLLYVITPRGPRAARRGKGKDAMKTRETYRTGSKGVFVLCKRARAKGSLPEYWVVKGNKSYYVGTTYPQPDIIADCCR